MSAQRLLTFNAHEAYVYALAQIGHQWDVVDFLPGRYTKQWDRRIRPVPDNVRLLTIGQALSHQQAYDCIIAHSIDDLLLVKTVQKPKILVIHISLTGYMKQEGSKTPIATVREKLKLYLNQIHAVAVSVSRMKQKTWDLSGPIIPFYIDTDFFNGYRGDIAGGLRIANQIAKKALLLNWPLHSAICQGIPVKVVGYNPDMPDVHPAKDTYELRELCRSRRFYVYTAQYDYEDGYNMASLEAMACGMPLICNSHPSTPVVNGVNGFVSDNVPQLREHIMRLLADRPLAQKLGRAARQTVLEQNTLKQFRQGWEESIELAKSIF